MSFFRRTFWASYLLGLGFFYWTDVNVGAGENQNGNKKSDVQAPAPLLKKTDELNADDEKDTKRTKSPCKVYTIELSAGKVYQIDLKSNDFDAYLRLENPDGKQVAFNDDAGVSTFDSRIFYRARKAGEYKIIATSFDGAAGKFTLTVTETTPAVAAAALLTKGSKYQGPAVDLKLKDGKTTYLGELTAKDDLAFKRHYKNFAVQLQKGKSYRIEYLGVDQKTFTPYLSLEDADGVEVEVVSASDDDPSAKIVYKVAKTGTYHIIATTVGAKQTGRFTLDIGAPDAEEAKKADFKYRITHYATLSPVQRKNVIQQVNKQLQEKGEDLAFADTTLAIQIGVEAELEDIDLAREVYKAYVKIFANASNAQVAKVSTRLFQSFLKNLDKIGTEFEITGTKLDGKEFDLKSLKGKVVLVDFWGTWCGPCVAEIPNMVKAYEKYHGKGFEVIGVSSDKQDDVVIDFMEARNLPWGCLNVADSRKMIRMHGVTGYPHPVLIGPDGRIVSLQGRGPQLERLLERLLVEKK